MLMLLDNHSSIALIWQDNVAAAMDLVVLVWPSVLVLLLRHLASGKD